MSHIFGKLWHSAIIWPIRKSFECILQDVRFLLANHTLLSGTSETFSFILYIVYFILLLIVHGMAGEPSMPGLSRQISQFRCVLARMLFKNKSKMVKIIFPEWDRSPHQQAPCHHGVHHLGASWPLQAGRYFKYFEYFESSPVVIIQKVIAKYLQLLQSQRHWKICLSMVLLQNSSRPSYFHLGMGLFLWCSNLKTHDHLAELGKYVLMLPHGTWRTEYDHQY